MTEIKIHKSLHHNFIVEFEHVFEDAENVYILLELCRFSTLNEKIKKKKKFTVAEVIHYGPQILSALDYLHSHRIIH